jgi:RNA polymerase sigma factor (TIGR02999 family)
MDDIAGEITVLLKKVRAGEQNADGRLAELVYHELHRIAAKRMRSERGAHTLTATALVNEAWLRLGPDMAGMDFKDRQHFFAVAATAMRRILVDYARARKSSKRGGAPLQLDANALDVPPPKINDNMMLAVNDALERLAGVKPRAAHVVEMRFFMGLTHQEIATALQIERRTVERDWVMARAWLIGEISSK